MKKFLAFALLLLITAATMAQAVSYDVETLDSRWLGTNMTRTADNSISGAYLFKSLDFVASKTYKVTSPVFTVELSGTDWRSLGWAIFLFKVNQAVGGSASSFTAKVTVRQVAPTAGTPVVLDVLSFTGSVQTAGGELYKYAQSVVTSPVFNFTYGNGYVMEFELKATNTNPSTANYAKMDMFDLRKAIVLLKNGTGGGGTNNCDITTGPSYPVIELQGQALSGGTTKNLKFKRKALSCTAQWSNYYASHCYMPYQIIRENISTGERDISGYGIVDMPITNPNVDETFTVGPVLDHDSTYYYYYQLGLSVSCIASASLWEVIPY